jgi:mRNA-degrading endonuclease YafQ of YafQ-DinJ toxin-antitoxin module
VRYAYTSLFSRSYGALKPAEKQRITAALDKFCRKPHYPFPRGLRVHKLKGVSGTPDREGDHAPDVWEMHATRGLLITFQYGDGEVIFRNCGQHDDVLRSP